jgi:hypothetical protein
VIRKKNPKRVTREKVRKLFSLLTYIEKSAQKDREKEDLNNMRVEQFLFAPGV